MLLNNASSAGLDLEFVNGAASVTHMPRKKEELPIPKDQLLEQTSVYPGYPSIEHTKFQSKKPHPECIHPYSSGIYVVYTRYKATSI